MAANREALAAPKNPSVVAAVAACLATGLVAGPAVVGRSHSWEAEGSSFKPARKRELQWPAWTRHRRHALGAGHMKRRPFILLPLLVSTPLILRADVYFHDAFDYAPGEDALTLAGRWASVRNPGAEADVVSGSLAYADGDGRQLRSSGNKALLDSAEEGVEVRHRADLDLSAHQGAVLWVSVLGQQTAGDARRFINLVFMTPDDAVVPADSNSDEDEAFALGVSSSSAPSNWSLYNRALNNGRQIAMSMVATSQASLLLARIEPNFAGGEAERYTFWVNPRLGVPPPEADGISFSSKDGTGAEASDFNQWNELIAIRIGAGAASGQVPAASWLVDEIRVGSDWTDVLPWSPALEWLEPLPAPSSAGYTVKWRPANGRTDVVEWSADLRGWTPYEASRHLGQPGEASVEFQVPASQDASHRFVRVRREP